MNLKSLAVGTLIMAAITLAWTANDLRLAISTPKRFYIGPTDDQNVALGRTLYVSHCAGCHGSKLEGQQNWQERRPDGRLPAPPHDATGHTWHHPDRVLFDITRNGLVPGHTAPAGYESDMPAYAGILSDREIMAVLAYIKSTWPREILELQDEVSRDAEKSGAR